MDIIIRSGKAVEPKVGATAIPLGVEYEELQRRIQKNIEKEKVERQDLRNSNKQLLDNVEDLKEKEKPKTTFLLVPGMMIPSENTSSDWKPYPTSEVPYQNSERWINR